MFICPKPISGIKIFLSALFLSFSLSGQASHYSMGYVTYSWVGDQPGYGTYDYAVEIGVYRNVNGIAIGSGSQALYINNHCTNNASTENISYIPPGFGQSHPSDPQGWAITTDYNCLGTQVLDWSLYLYRDTITLPGTTCSMYSFVPQFPCCRDAKDNITGSATLGILARLNNTQGPVSLPEPNHGEMLARLCNGQEFDVGGFLKGMNSYAWSFEPANPLNLSTDHYFNPVPFSSTYSVDTPMAVLNGHYQMDSTTGKINLHPLGIMENAIAVKYRQYQLDNQGNPYEAGLMHLETVISVGSTCSSHATDGPKLAFENDSSYIADSCGLSSVNLITNQKFQTQSLDTNGTDFLAVDSAGNPVPIVAAQANSGDSLSLSFQQPINSNQQIFITLKTGNDGNTLISKCGFESVDSSVFVLDISGCSGINLNEPEFHELNFYPVPSKGIVHFSGNGANAVSSATVMHMDGTRSRKVKIQNQMMDLQGWPKGIYLVKVNNKYTGKAEYHRIVLQ